jgi:thioredoxin reductase
MEKMDYLIIGAGPAGLQLGYLLAKAGRDFRILEAGSTPGTFFRQFPRHRTLISINKVYTGAKDDELKLRMDWNSLLSDDPNLLFARYSGRYFPAADDLLRYLADFAATHQLHIQYDTRVNRITRTQAGPFRVTDEQGRTYEAKRLIVATGVSKPYVPAIPGIETAELYANVSVEPRDFINQRVLIIGKGNSAFETAENLMETAAVIHIAGPHSLRFAWKTHYVGHLRAVNNNFLDTYQLKSQNALLDGNILKISKDGDGYLVTVSFSRANEVKKDLRYDRVIVCTGFRFDASIFAEDCRPELIINDRFPAQTSQWESVNVPDLYFAGTLMQVRDFKQSTSGFIHGFRYCVRALHRLFEQKYEGAVWPHTELPATAESLMEAVLARVNRSSALWQQFAFLCDLIVATRDGASYYEELPSAYVHESEFGRSDNYFTITLEYGPDHDQFDPFDVAVGRIAQDERERSHEGRYLHPVVRRFSRGNLVSTHHVTENLENDWTGEETHRQPLRAYFAREIAERPKSVAVPV